MLFQKILLHSKDNARKCINQFTYHDLYLRTRYITDRLRSQGVSKHHRVMISESKSMDWVCTMLATWNCGGIFVPVSKPNQILYKKVNPTVFIHNQEWKVSITEGYKHMHYDEIKCTDPALILFTSGTTSDPKGAVLSHKNLYSNIKDIDILWGSHIKKEDRSFSILPWHHCYGLVCELLYLLFKNAHINLPIGSDPKLIMKEIKWKSPSLLFTVPKMLETIMKIDQNLSMLPSCMRKILFFGPNLRFISVGGGHCHPEIIRYFKNILNISIYQGYGMTECSPMVTLETPEQNKIGSVGKTLPSVSLAIDPRNQEIIVQGENVMLGYLNESPVPFEINIQKKYNTIFRTGDKGTWLENDFLKINGRVKNEYKLSNGKYVDPSQLESILGLHPQIQQCLITHDSMFQYNTIIVYSNTSELDQNIFLQNIQNFCKNKMHDYEIPKKLILIYEPFSIENGLLSLKHEIKREQIISKFKIQ